jgi:ketosteroid isomerase-like protein
MKRAVVVVLCVATSIAHASPPTKDAALATLDAWVKAQNAGDLAAYAALYDAKFVGIKRTSNGQEKKLTLAKWKADRAKMFKGAQKVAAEDARVAIKGDDATITFVQRYQGGAYADHGDKELKLHASAAGGLAIIREEMLYSAPGWTADPQAEIDASALVSPIRARVRQQARAEDVGGCGSVAYTLELTDARGKKQTADLGGGFVPIEHAIEMIDADVTAPPLFKFGEYCAAGADYYEIKQSGDALIVRYQGTDETDTETPPWETRLTVRLAAGAKIK